MAEPRTTAEYVACRNERDCTRNNSRGDRCAQPRQGWAEDTGLPDPQSCRWHLTSDERSAQAEHNRRWMEEWREGCPELRLMVPVPGAPDTARVIKPNPACWYWPAPETVTFKDDDAAHQFLSWWHNGMCAMCGSRGDLVTDHDHRSGNVRGRLCRSCNSLEGHAGNEGRFGKYRRRNPASILGIQVRYWAPFTGYAQPEPDLTDADRADMRDAVDEMSLPPVV